jgi:chromosomal replication initiation ATPase DnaA
MEVNDPRVIVKKIADDFGLSLDELISKRRDVLAIKARVEVIKTLKVQHLLSFPVIGYYLHRDPSTIYSLYKRYVKNIQ